MLDIIWRGERYAYERLGGGNDAYTRTDDLGRLHVLQQDDPLEATIPEAGGPARYWVFESPDDWGESTPPVQSETVAVWMPE